MLKGSSADFWLKASYLDSIQKGLSLIFFFFLPFNYALTFNIGFPLKISEVVLILLLFLEVIKFRSAAFSFDSHLFRVAILFLLVSLLSLVINLNWNYPYKLDYQFARFSPLVDSVFKYVYYLVVFYAFYISAKLNNKFPKNYYGLILGGVVAALYTWYLFIWSIQGKEPYLLPGMDAWPQHGLYSFGHFIRCGTFKEGNYMGFYLFTTALIAWHKRAYWVALFLFLSVLPTVSSMAISCSLLFLVVVISLYLMRRKHYFLLALASLACLGGVFKLSQNEDFRSLIIAKLTTERPPAHVRSAGWSGEDRKNSNLVSFKIGKKNFFFGVGPANYYLHYNHINQQTFFESKAGKRIPNNVYLELFSELGIFCLVLFLVFLWLIFRHLTWSCSANLKVGLLISCVYLVAFPTFAILFLWSFYGYIYAQKDSHDNFR